jgi:hypothetical protein
MILLHWKMAYLSVPKFLAGCHYNEEEISQHLKRNIGYWPVQIHGIKFATGQILEKTGRSCEGADFSWLSSKVPQTLLLVPKNLKNYIYMRFINDYMKWAYILAPVPSLIPLAFSSQPYATPWGLQQPTINI